MSIHLRIPEYICKHCRTPFMPYIKALECPKCGVKEDSETELKGHNFIDDQIWSMLYHIDRYKRFTPGAWFKGCYCDWLQILIYTTFDHVYNNPESSLENKSKRIEMYDGEGNVYSNDKYIYNLFTAIDEKLKVRLKEKKIHDKKLKTRIIKFLYRKLME